MPVAYSYDHFDTLSYIQFAPWCRRRKRRRPGRRIRWLTKGHPASKPGSSPKSGAERERTRCPINRRPHPRGTARGGLGGAGGYRHKGQLKSQSSGPNYVEKRGGVRERGRSRAREHRYTTK